MHVALLSADGKADRMKQTRKKADMKRLESTARNRLEKDVPGQLQLELHCLGIDRQMGMKGQETEKRFGTE